MPKSYGQGEWEWNEALTLDRVFKDLKKKYPNVDIIGGGDTNIKGLSNNNAFASDEYKLNYVDFDTNKEDYLTSLSTKHYAYAKNSSYDKWFIYDYGQLNVLAQQSNIPYKFDVLQAYQKGYWDKQAAISSFHKTDPNKGKPTNLQLVSKVSDHAPILLDVQY
ncbi:hypothetical protein [Mycoplasma sp. E35C]|uniref:hypothetical protein n=1 Tax=Mycoplasma sp. E35C TaxID=2801918 RepID=UPI001CA3F143|nr:hypothetical protein [Mycoplasma sp. E35C]QZX49160.1 hypothetical protein JJE79_00060 [Mycoplasma sp. E35C]